MLGLKEVRQLKAENLEREVKFSFSSECTRKTRN